MTVARTWSVALAGVEGEPVEVEADLSKQTPEFKIIGLPDKALGEAVQRVHNACANSGLSLPRRRLTVNLSPASLPKHGSGFDVAIAIASLATEGPMDAASVASTVHLGELGLDGRLRPVPGILPAVVAAARAGHRRVVVPFANRAEAELVDGDGGARRGQSRQVAAWHGADVEVPDDEPVSAGDADETTVAERARPRGRHRSARGRRGARRPPRRAATTCSCAGHPAPGKTMLARRLPGILPDLDDRAALTAASIRSLCGSPVKALSRTPPFEAPHHTASVAALVGGGSRVLRPGAIARATEGILFLDEAGEFQASALDALRQPLESGTITIHRATATAQFPARFQLILATNPCPCGDYGIRGGTCTCVPAAIRRYLGQAVGAAAGPDGHRAHAGARLGRTARRAARRRHHDGDRPVARRGGEGPCDAPARRDAMATERAASRHLAARRAGSAARDRAPSARCRAAPRRADAPRVRPGPPSRMDHRGPRWEPAARLGAHRPSAVPEEGDRAMTAFELTSAAARRALRPDASSAARGRRGHRRALRAHRVESPHRAGGRRGRPADPRARRRRRAASGNGRDGGRHGAHRGRARQGPEPVDASAEPGRRRGVAADRGERTACRS